MDRQVMGKLTVTFDKTGRGLYINFSEISIAYHYRSQFNYSKKHDYSETNIASLETYRVGSYDIAVPSEFDLLKIYWPNFSQLLMFSKYLIICCFHLYK
jgi:hypothetical protein